MTDSGSDDALLFCLQDGALDLLRELKNIKMSLETLQVINSTPLPCHRTPPSAPEVQHDTITSTLEAHSCLKQYNRNYVLYIWHGW